MNKQFYFKQSNLSYVICFHSLNVKQFYLNDRYSSMERAKPSYPHNYGFLFFYKDDFGMK